MTEIKTSYGIISGVERAEYYKSGALQSIITLAPVTLHTSYGDLVPAYHLGDVRKKYRDTVEFYESGNLKSIYLEEQTAINTPVGDIAAEHITFYENGQIRRIFPLYGRLDGYWTEQNEFELAKEVTLPLLERQVVCKPLCIHFYPSGALRSVTIWNKTTLTVETPYGAITTKVGVELYENGPLQSIEPAFGTRISTAWGDLSPFDTEAFMMHADHNSLKFDTSGNVISLKTIQNKVTVTKDGKTVATYIPQEVPDAMNLEIKVRKPLTIGLQDNEITIELTKDEKYTWNTQDVGIHFLPY